MLSTPKMHRTVAALPFYSKFVETRGMPAPGGEVRLRSGLETASVEMRERVGDVGAALSYRPAPNGRAAHVLHQSDTYESLVAASFIKHTLAKDPE